jgi:hypothetical protein
LKGCLLRFRNFPITASAMRRPETTLSPPSGARAAAAFAACQRGALRSLPASLDQGGGVGSQRGSLAPKRPTTHVTADSELGGARGSPMRADASGMMRVGAVPVMWLSPCFSTFLFKSASEVDVGSLMRAHVCCLSGALLRAHLFTCIYRGVAVLGPRGIKVVLRWLAGRGVMQVSWRGEQRISRPYGRAPVAELGEFSAAAHFIQTRIQGAWR